MASQARMDRARKRLEQYRNAQHELDYLSSRIETLEAKVMRATTTPDVHAGWTGQYWGRSAKGYGWMYSDNPDDLLNPRKVKAIPKAQHGTSDPKAGEKLLIALIDQQLEYERRALAALDLCLAIEAEIDDACVGIWATALKYRYLEDLTYREIGDRMNYSISQVRRLIDEAFNQYSEKMAKKSKNGKSSRDIM